MLVVEVRSLLIALHQRPMNNCYPPLRKLRHQFLDHNLQSRIVIPALLQKVKTRILPRIRRSIQFFPSYRSNLRPCNYRFM
ncbi:hypothetical protein H6G96_36175 [Nostoc sp. FACHB-892]|uniref:hypothetical protein n=1 Tax=Nostoc sp. FACHB-892 TaxID=2692843 RepID=UPI00168A139E|nr:hypothetical protein [Nostoc sp. FACHB-892]MBD2731579.1 hypothetical protein [Nostoc sp. FACHB-892]